MTQRIPLDSELWDTDHWYGVDDPREALRAIIEADSPDPSAIQHMIEGTYYVDFPSPHFFYLAPYLIDIFEVDIESLLSPLQLFCLYTLRATDGQPEKRWMDQLTSSQPRLFKTLEKVLNFINSDPDAGYDDYKWVLAGMAAALGQSDLGRQINGLTIYDEIN